MSAPGEIDAANVDELRQALLSCLDATRTTLVVDMSQTTFCDSAGCASCCSRTRAWQPEAASCAW